MFLAILELCYLFSFGGPDGYGYLFLATRDGDPLYFYWEDITQTGTHLNLGDDDYAAIELPFPFPFYDAVYNYAVVGSNGLIYFADQYVGMENECLPTQIYGVGDLIAIYWSDLNPEDSLSGVYYRNFSSYTVIEYYRVPVVGLPGRNTFEIVLTPTGYIELRYLSMESYSDETVGIQDATAQGGNNWFLEYVCMGSPSLRIPDDSSAVLFVPPWVSLKEKVACRRKTFREKGNLVIGRSSLNLCISSPSEDIIELKLYGASGRNILKIEGFHLYKGENTLRLPENCPLPNGYYRAILKGKKVKRVMNLLLLR